VRPRLAGRVYFIPSDPQTSAKRNQSVTDNYLSERVLAEGENAKALCAND